METILTEKNLQSLETKKNIDVKNKWKQEIDVFETKMYRGLQNNSTSKESIPDDIFGLQRAIRRLEEVPWKTKQDICFNLWRHESCRCLFQNKILGMFSQCVDWIVNYSNICVQQDDIILTKAIVLWIQILTINQWIKINVFPKIKYG